MVSKFYNRFRYLKPHNEIYVMSVMRAFKKYIESCEMMTFSIKYFCMCRCHYICSIIHPFFLSVISRRWRQNEIIKKKHAQVFHERIIFHCICSDSFSSSLDYIKISLKTHGKFCAHQSIIIHREDHTEKTRYAIIYLFKFKDKFARAKENKPIFTVKKLQISPQNRGKKFFISPSMHQLITEWD